MARRSLRPQLNQIRTWVQQGRTDAWIAHQLEVTVQQIASFKRDNDLAPAEAPPESENGTDILEDEFDLRAQDDARIAEELEAAEAERLKQEALDAEREAEEAKRRAEAGESDEDEDDDDKPARRRGRRGGRGRRRGKSTGPYEGTFDHGDEGYGLWLDPSIQDNAVYAEHWAGERAIEVSIEEDQIVIRRIGPDSGATDED